MPLYEYKCHTCGKTIEVLQRFSDDPLKTHEGCGGEVERLISASAFHLKGSGWYATDYAKSNGEKAGDAGDKEKKAEDKKAAEKKSDEKKTESKSGESAATPSTSSSGESKSEAKPAQTESKPKESKPAAPAGDSKS